MFVVHQSNRTEELIATLAEVLAEPLPDPLQPEIIAVQSLGMRTWLSQQLARRLGIWANGQFPFPRAFIGRVAEQVLGRSFREGDPYSPETMTWAVLAALPTVLDEPGCGPLRRYLTGEQRELKTYQLARRIAGVFDQYCLYRRELVLGWEAGEGSDWQALLFRRIRELLGPGHQARILEDVLAGLSEDWSQGDLPPRVSVFGISSLPPAYLDVLVGLGGRLDVHFFLLNPCAHYWADLARAGQIARQAEASRTTEAQVADRLHLEEGHPLLASLGSQGQDLHKLLAQRDAFAMADDRFVDPLEAGADAALTRLQSNILTLYDPERDGPRPPLSPGDRSVAVHACHAPMREVEVLHDQLRALFEEDGSLMPDDVLVMSPDIETYAPLVEAVFAGGHDGGVPIPFGISDRRQRAEAQVVEAFLALLDLLGGRFGIDSVFDLLAVPPVRERFGLAADELDLARGWASDAGIRWGLDAGHREANGLPGLSENTWRFGLERMLLGYAMPADERRLFAGRLAYDEIEGLEAATLGNLAAFHHALERAQRTLAKPRAVNRWRDDLVVTLAGLVAEDGDNHHQHQFIRDTLASLAEAAERTGFDQSVPLAVLLQAVRERLDERRTSLGFLAGGVTFCNLQPMRSLPFRVVCLLGMNDRIFPRVERPLAFDLRSAERRLGDRDSRDDDRFMFLEALLAARERLIITFVGRSIRDDSPLPPSVVVSELLDALWPGVADEARITQHPLQPFSRGYFDSSQDQLFSYSQVWCQAAQAAAQDRDPEPVFLPVALPAAEPDEEPIQLADLIRFLRGPVTWLLERRLGLSLRPTAELNSEREPLQLDKLEEYVLGEALLGEALETEAGDWDRLQAIQRAAGRLPPGAAGDALIRVLAGRIEPIVRIARPLLAGPVEPPLPVDLRLGPERLVGTLHDLRPQGQVVVGYGQLNAGRLLVGWLRHLALAAVAGPAQARTSVLLGRGAGDEPVERVALGTPSKDPATLLTDMVAIFRHGQTRPLRFFPDSSLAYAQALAGKDPGDPAAVAAAEQRAYDSYRSSPFRPRPGEGDHPAVRKALGALDPIGSAPEVDGFGFGQVALRVWGPFLEAGVRGGGE